MWGIIFQVRGGRKLVLELSSELGRFVAYLVIFRMFWIENLVLNACNNVFGNGN